MTTTIPTSQRVLLLCVALFVVLFSGAGCIFGWLSATALMTGDAASADERQSFAIALQVAGVARRVLRNT